MAFDFSFNQLRAGFFDTAAVQKEVAALERKTLSRFGAYTRQRIRSSLKYRPGKSQPGRPPHVHTSGGITRTKRNKAGQETRQTVSPLRDLVFFAYDPGTRSVVVGPAKFGGKGGVVPKLLEQGGTGTFRDPNSGEIKRGVWAPRPFVRPAGEAEVAAGKYLLPGG